ncbi:hypothetical protein Efla_006472 [Eimeria flavescens]
MNHGQRSDGGAESDRGTKTQVSQVAQLFARLQQEIEEAKPGNAIHFIVNFLCKHYPEHLKGFASVWNADPELEKERLLVVEFFKAQKLPTDIAFAVMNTYHLRLQGKRLLLRMQLETLCTLTAESLDDIEKFNQTRWLPGHKVRLQQTFADIAGRVRAFTEERDYLIRAATGYCPHPQIVSKQTLAPLQQTALTSTFPASNASCWLNGSANLPIAYRAPQQTTLYSPSSSPPVITYSTELPRN